MSYILDALRKLEKEKASARKEVDLVKQMAMLEYSSSVISSGSPLWVRVALGLFVGAVLIGTTYLTTRHVFLSTPSVPMSSGKGGSAVTEEMRQGHMGVSGTQVEQDATKESAAKNTISQDNTVLLGRRESASEIESEGGAVTDNRGYEPLPQASLPKSEDRFPISQPDMPEKLPAIEDNESVASEGFDGDLVAKAERKDMERERYPAMHPPPGAPALKISAIAWSPDTLKRFAVVNLKSVHEGDSIEGALVSEIQLDGIVFRWQGIQYKLLMSRH